MARYPCQIWISTKFQLLSSLLYVNKIIFARCNFFKWRVVILNQNPSHFFLRIKKLSVRRTFIPFINRFATRTTSVKPAMLSATLFKCLCSCFLVFCTLSTISAQVTTIPWYENLPAVAMDYKVHIDPGKEDCYFQYVNPGATFYVSFQVSDKVRRDNYVKYRRARTLLQVGNKIVNIWRLVVSVTSDFFRINQAVFIIRGLNLSGNNFLNYYWFVGILNFTLRLNVKQPKLHLLQFFKTQLKLNETMWNKYFPDIRW